MKNITLFSFVISLCLFGCSNKPKEDSKNPSATKAFHEINLSVDFSGSNCDNLLLSDIVEDVEYIQLETTDDCLINQYVSCVLTDKDIYVLNKFSTKEELLRFDRKTGKFISKIGQIGQGPKDMLQPSGVYADNTHVYVPSNITNKVYVYQKDDTFVKSVALGRCTGEQISVVQGKYIICHPGQDFEVSENNEEGNRNLYYGAKILDMDGNTLMAKSDTLYGEKPTLTLDWTPKRWYYNGELNFYNEIDATVYAANEKGIFPRYKFNLGDNQWIVTGPAGKGHLKYIKFHHFKETTDYLYICWNQHEKVYMARFNKKTEELNVSEETPFKGRLWLASGYGPKNDIDGFNSYWGPGGIHENQSGSFIYTITPGNIDKTREALKKAENVKFPEKRQQLLKMLDERKDDDNPILVIYKLKK